MIKSLRIGNFKAFKEVQEIPIKPITLIFGPNSSGKSSILHSLLFIEEYADRLLNGYVFSGFGPSSLGNIDIYTIRKDEEVIDLGGVSKILNQNSSNREITIGGKFTDELKLDENQIDKNHDWESGFEPEFLKVIEKCETEGCNIYIKINLDWTLKYTLDEENKIYLTEFKLLLDKYWVRIEDYNKIELLDKTYLHEDNPVSLVNIGRKNDDAYELVINDFDMSHDVMRVLGVKYNLFYRDYLYAIDEFNNNRIRINSSLMILPNNSHILTGISYEFLGSFIDRLFRIVNYPIHMYSSAYLGPLRSIPSRLYGASNEKQDAWSLLLEKRYVRERVNDLLELIGLDYEIIVEEYVSSLNDKRTHNFLSLRDKTNGSILSLKDVGTGLSQILPILVELKISKNDIYIEQPELHLHPALQSKWGKILSHYYQKLDKVNGGNLIMETHSEHIIKSLQLEVTKYTSSKGEEGISKEDVAILYVSKVNGKSQVREIKLDDSGSFTEPWPDDFFDLSANLSLERLRESVKSKN